MTHITGQRDADLHHANGEHRSTPATTRGSLLGPFEDRLRAHLALHAEMGPRDGVGMSTADTAPGCRRCNPGLPEGAVTMLDCGSHERGETYQGWTNWDTWDANLWLTNDESAYRLALECIDEFALSALFEETFDTVTGPTGYIDGIDPDKVNWAEIFESLHEGEEK